jgi:crossover junction endodeoxyribonuclease RuvC
MKSPRTPELLGLDLSLTATGYAENGGTGLIHAPKGETGITRIDSIAREVQHRAAGKDLVILEAHSFSARQQYAHEIGELFGVVKWLLHNDGHVVIEVPPARLKKFATGKGNAGKDEVIAGAIRALGFPGSNNNEADAWVLYQMGVYWYRGNLDMVPVYRSQVLEAMDWPVFEVHSAQEVPFPEVAGD